MCDNDVSVSVQQCGQTVYYVFISVTYHRDTLDECKALQEFMLHKEVRVLHYIRKTALFEM